MSFRTCRRNSSTTRSNSSSYSSQVTRGEKLRASSRITTRGIFLPGGSQKRRRHYKRLPPVHFRPYPKSCTCISPTKTSLPNNNLLTLAHWQGSRDRFGYVCLSSIIGCSSIGMSLLLYLLSMPYSKSSQVFIHALRCWMLCNLTESADQGPHFMILPPKKLKQKSLTTIRTLRDTSRNQPSTGRELDSIWYSIG